MISQLVYAGTRTRIYRITEISMIRHIHVSHTLWDYSKAGVFISAYWFEKFWNERTIFAVYNQISHQHVRYITYSQKILDINPWSSHDALKHHFRSLKNRFNFPTTKGFRMKFPRNWFTNRLQFSLIFHPTKIIFIHYKSRIATAIRGL